MCLFSLLFPSCLPRYNFIFLVKLLVNISRVKLAPSLNNPRTILDRAFVLFFFSFWGKTNDNGMKIRERRSLPLLNELRFLLVNAFASLLNWAEIKAPRKWWRSPSPSPHADKSEDKTIKIKLEFHLRRVVRSVFLPISLKTDEREIGWKRDNENRTHECKHNFHIYNEQRGKDCRRANPFRKMRIGGVQIHPFLSPLVWSYPKQINPESCS